MVPKNLRVKKLLERHVANKEVTVDRVYELCHAINCGMLKIENYGGEFIHLYSKILIKIVGNDYVKVLTWMIKAGIIEVDGSYSTGQYSKGYRFTDHYRGAPVTFKTVKGKIKTLKQDIKCISSVGKKLSKFYKAELFKIDLKAAKQIIKNEYAEGMKLIDVKNRASEVMALKCRILNYTKNVNSIANGSFVFSQDGFGKRLYNPLTGLSKKFRHLVTYNEQHLVEVDLSNSQLFFAVKLIYNDLTLCFGQKISDTWINDLKKVLNMIVKCKTFDDYTINTILNIDIEGDISYRTTMYQTLAETLDSKDFQSIITYFKDASEGKIYEKLLNKLESDGYFDKYQKNLESKSRRSYVKEILLKQIFASKTLTKHSGLFKLGCMPIYDAFKTLYPSVERLFDRIKSLDHKKLSKALQTIESQAIQDNVCKQIMKKHPKIPIFTIHDCLVTTIGNEEILKLEVPRIIGEYVGLSPAVSTKYWFEAPNKAA